jgi:UDP-glucose 4-epimerase
MARVLITGGAGYIGAHVAHDLLTSGYEVRIFDDFSNGLERRIVGFEDIHRADILDRSAVFNAMKGVDAVIHLVAKKAVGESVTNPLKYYDNNVGGILNVLAAMSSHGVKRIVFSSTAAVYAPSNKDSISEEDSTIPLSPYGATKLLSEEIINVAGRAEHFSSISLRYFNVVGAGSDDLGDNSRDNLVPKVFQALEEGKSPEVFGDDYPTPDGTCIRDYIHVSDLSKSHIAALRAIEESELHEVYNVGSGTGYSVHEVINQIEKTIGRSTHSKVVERRAGDTPKLIAGIEKITKDLGWKPEKSLKEMIDSAWQAWNSK